MTEREARQIVAHPLYRLLSDTSLLSKLLSGGKQAAFAWEEFLRRYSGLILKLIWEFERDRDEAMEKYLFVCTKLAENEFARLSKFKTKYGTNPPKFSTWLATVVHNLCIDAYRKTHPRRRYPKTLTRMTPLYRRVFELYYWRGMSPEEVQALIDGSGGSNGETVGEIIERIERSLTQRHEEFRRASVPPVFIAVDPSNLSGDVADSSHTYDAFIDRLEFWMSELTDEERLVLRLRFWEDMSAPEIAEALRITPQFRVYDIVNRALAHLRKRSARTPGR